MRAPMGTARWGSLIAIVLAFVLSLTLAATASAAARPEASAEFRPSPYAGGVLVSIFEPRTGHITLATLGKDGPVPVRLPDSNMRPWAPDRYGTRIVFEDARAGGSFIVVYDVASKTVTRIPGGGEDSEPAIWEDTVVFSRITDRGARIFAYDLGTKELRNITPHAKAAVAPDIYASTIVFSERGDIWTATLEDPEAARQLTDFEGEQGTPAVWADRVVYADWSGGLADLREQSLATGRDRELVTGERAQMAPALWGSKLAYEDYEYFPPLAHAKVRTLDDESAGLGSWLGNRITAWLGSWTAEHNS